MTQREVESRADRLLNEHDFLITSCDKLKFSSREKRSSPFMAGNKVAFETRRRREILSLLVSKVTAVLGLERSAFRNTVW